MHLIFVDLKEVSDQVVFFTHVLIPIVNSPYHLVVYIRNKHAGAADHLIRKKFRILDSPLEEEKNSMF